MSERPVAPGDRDPDALVRRAGARGDPNHDQHFLVDDRVVDRIPGYLPEDADRSHVLEVGGGPGVLTDRLLASAPPDGRVTVVERDPMFAGFLREEFADAVGDGRLSVLEGDALDVSLPEFSACVSNLPYGVSSEIAFRLLPEKKPLVLMFQREFAERMAAAPGDDEYGRLSVTAGHYADVEVVEPVPKEAFSPVPAVESAVVRVTPRDPDYEVPGEARRASGSASGDPPRADAEFFLQFVTAVFTQRRKTVRNAIRNTAHISELDAPEAVVEAADEELLSARAGDLAPAEFAALAELAWAVGEPR
jgi:16S rRNA (adenine1518-N6/adenine1519-N6)-dimethyltransferase